MRLVVSAKAAQDVAHIFKYIAQHNPLAAARVVDAIYARVTAVAESGFGYLGRRGDVRGTRQIVEAPYIISYRFDEARDEIRVVSVVHGARRR